MTVSRELPSVFSLGVGLTNACNLSCAHCYRQTDDSGIGAKDVLRVVEALPTRVVSFGTGENGLHPEFEDLVRALVTRGIDVTMTTNGLSARELPDTLLARMSDVEFSIDHAEEAQHDFVRGSGNWALVEEQMARCRDLGVRTTLVVVMMSSNHGRMPAIARLAALRGALLRVNVYQPVHTEAYAPTYEQFWTCWRDLLEVTDVLVCGEPILRAVLGLHREPWTGCGTTTVRLTPRGGIVPCVYAGDSALGVDDVVRLGPAIVGAEVFERHRMVPDACTSCPHVDTCGGGCANRRVLAGGLGRPDPYCPFVRGESPHLAWRGASPERVPAKAASACTTILRPRVLS